MSSFRSFRGGKENKIFLEGDPCRTEGIIRDFFARNKQKVKRGIKESVNKNYKMRNTEEACSKHGLSFQIQKLIN